MLSDVLQLCLLRMRKIFLFSGGQVRRLVMVRLSVLKLFIILGTLSGRGIRSRRLRGLGLELGRRSWSLVLVPSLIVGITLVRMAFKRTPLFLVRLLSRKMLLLKPDYVLLLALGRALFLVRRLRGMGLELGRRAESWLLGRLLVPLIIAMALIGMALRRAQLFLLSRNMLKPTHYVLLLALGMTLFLVRRLRRRAAQTMRRLKLVLGWQLVPSLITAIALIGMDLRPLLLVRLLSRLMLLMLLLSRVIGRRIGQLRI